MQSRHASSQNSNATAPLAPSPTPATSKPSATLQPETSSPIDALIKSMIQTQNELSANPIFRCQLSKRGF